jgi:hypothetical protein
MMVILGFFTRRYKPNPMKTNPMEYQANRRFLDSINASGIIVVPSTAAPSRSPIMTNRMPRGTAQFLLGTCVM